jgi:hypothetical protein
MNESIRELKKQAEKFALDIPAALDPTEFDDIFIEKFVELIKQAIYDQVKEELIPDDIIATEPPELQEYLKGCNGGTVDALCHIKNFAIDFDPRIM